MNTFWTFSLLASVLTAADLNIYQKLGEHQVIEVRGTDTAGNHFTADGGTVLVTPSLSYDVVGFLSSSVYRGLPTEIHLDALEENERATVGVFVDGQLPQWYESAKAGLLTTVLPYREVTLVILREDGTSSARRLQAIDYVEETTKSFGRFSTATSGPLSLRFIVAHRNTFCEVAIGSGLGGRFVSATPRTQLGYTTTCKTDRVSRGETIVTLVTGSGVGFAGIDIPIFPEPFAGNRLLPFAEVRGVINDPRADNLVAFVRQGNFHARLRVPIGSRP